MAQQRAGTGVGAGTELGRIGVGVDAATGTGAGTGAGAVTDGSRYSKWVRKGLGTGAAVDLEIGARTCVEIGTVVDLGTGVEATNGAVRAYGPWFYLWSRTVIDILLITAIPASSCALVKRSGAIFHFRNV